MVAAKLQCGGIIETQQHVRKGADRSAADPQSAGRQQPDVGLYHVAGILVHAAPRDVRDVIDRIVKMPGALVHAESGGKVAATLEGERSADLVAALNAIQRMPGVVSAVLVSEHSEPIAALDEEIDPCPKTA